MNAVLNGASTLLLMAGFIAIRKKNKALHRLCMVSAFLVSALFLISYLTYHAKVGSVPFKKTGNVRAVYFFILVTHSLLAAAIVPLALATLHAAWKNRFDRHVALARWTLPIWMYVSVTGVAVYWMLYRI